MTFQTSDSSKYLFVGTKVADLNVNAASFTVGSFSDTQVSGFNSPTPYTSSGAGAVSGFGNFNMTIKQSAGFSSASTSITFNLTNTSGNWSSAANVLTPNANGIDAAAHIAVCNVSGCPQAGGAMNTGYAAVPEPASIALFAGLLVFARHGRRRLST